MVSMKLEELIKELKRRGYTDKEIEAYLNEHRDEFEDIKVPCLRTIQKYYSTSTTVSHDGCAKHRAFSVFESIIIEVVVGLPKGYTISSIYDMLKEKFVGPDSEEKLDELPGSERTLRNFIKALKEEGKIPKPENGRKYQYVFDSAPGDQALIDFGELVPNGCTTRVHFICVLLRYSRYLYVSAQDHKFSSEEACRAIYWSFCKFGGRPRTLVIDQDAVFVASEQYGEVVETTTFREFLQEQDLKLWTCRKADPEGKGPIENSVKFVKSNFFSARTFDDPSEVSDRLPGWMQRKNDRIHQGIYRVPSVLLREIEQPELRPLLPSKFDQSELAYIPRTTKGKAFIQYKSNRYWVSDEYSFSQLYFRIFNDKIIIYDENKAPLREHYISELKGVDVIDDADKRSDDNNWLLRADKLRARWNVTEMEHLINGFKKESQNDTRLLARQLSALYDFLDKNDPPLAFISQVVADACKCYRYRFTQFKAMYEKEWAEWKPDLFTQTTKEIPLKRSDPYIAVASRDMMSYGDAFKSRCNS